MKKGNNLMFDLMSIKDFSKELGKPESLITHVADRHGHDQRYAIDPHKANVELGWDPVTCFEVGIKKTIAWYKSKLGKKWLDECIESEQAWLKDNYEDRK